MKRAALFVVLLVLLFGCPKHMRPTVPPPDDSEWCFDACENLRRLRCEEGKNVVDPDGIVVTCEVFCIETQLNSIHLNPKCIAGISSCREVETTCRFNPL